MQQWCKCVRCARSFTPEIAEDSNGDEYVVSTKLCYYCFEDGVEEYEDKRRERIARDNEY